MQPAARQPWALGGQRTTLLAVAGLAAVLALLYWPAVTLRGVFYVGDIYRLGYPARQVYTEALAVGRIPLWTPDALAGYPLLAEGQTGAYYPLNLLLHRWLPMAAALNYSVLLALWIGGAGAFLYARSLRLRRAPAFLAGCIFMMGGFLPGHLNHLNMLAAVAWLPLMLWAVERAASCPNWRLWTLVATLFGLQGLAGHPQISLLTALLLVAYAACAPLSGAWSWDMARQGRQVARCVAALVFGAGLAMVQWAPTYELTRLSQRGQGLDSEFFTSFSLRPEQWITMLWPFVRGNPYPLTSLETIAYVGALPLVLAVLAPLRRRDRRVAFWLVMALLGLLMTLGRWNPVYKLLLHVPILNMFRVPARYLLWVDLGIGVLAAIAFDSLLALTSGEATLAWRLGAYGSLVALGIGGVHLSRLPLETLIAAWSVLPAFWLLASVALLLALRWRPPSRLWSATVVALLLMDLWAFNAVYNRTYNDVMPPGEFDRSPELLRFLTKDADGEPYRIYTLEGIVPVLPVMRESLYPNMQLLHGVESINGYYPLVPGAQQWMLENLNARLLDLLNVRYVLIPQILPVDEDSEFYDTEDPFAPSIVGRSFEIPPRQVAGIEVEGYLSHSADLADGTPVGEIVMRGMGGEEVTWTLRAGEDLAEWAYARDDVLKSIRHSLAAQVVRTWPACSGYPPRAHPGQTFLSRYSLGQPFEVHQIEVRPLIPRAYLRLERVRLIDAAGSSELLSALVGEGDHVLVYRSADVAVYRNEEAGPRAWLVHRARVVQSEGEARRTVTAGAFDPLQQVIINAGQEMDGETPAVDRVAIEAYQPEYVRLRVMTPASGYVVLADSWYPGWTAQVDGRRVEVLRADACLRAVAVPAGEHAVEFRFSPASWRLGAWVSGVAWALVAVALVGRGCLLCAIIRMQ